MPPIVRQDKRFTFDNRLPFNGSTWAYLSHLELSRWHIGRGGVPAYLRLHFHGERVFRRGETDLTRSPYTIPGCTYAPTSITPGAGLPHERLFPLSACPVRDPRAGAVRAAFHTSSIAAFCLAVKGRKKPPPRQQRGRAIRFIPLRLLLPLALVGLPPRRERWVFRGEGGVFIHTNICRKRFVLLQTERRHVEVYHAQFIQHQ